MNNVCALANTGISKHQLILVAAILMAIAGAALFINKRKGAKHVMYLLVGLMFASSLILFPTQATAQVYCEQSAGAESSGSDNEENNSRVWSPQGRFIDSVFSEDNIDIQEDVVFG